MAIRIVTRQMEVDFLPIPQAPGYTVFFARWVGETDFKWAIVEEAIAELWMADLQDMAYIEDTRMPMPHLKDRKNVDTVWRAGRPMLIEPRGIELYQQLGYPFGGDHSVKYYEPTRWMEAIPADYHFVFWNGYDHSIVDQRGDFIVGTKMILACSESYNMTALDELVKNSDGKFAWLSEEHYYVRGNGMSNNIIVHFTQEEYTRFRMSGQMMSGVWDLCRFFGYDYKAYEAQDRDEDDDSF